jgi:RimJ/RimL family protein N-acetyltransferase
MSRLPEAILARRDELPRRPAPVVLTGRIVELRPLELDADLDALWAASSGQAHTLGDRSVPAYDADAQIWRYMSGGPFAAPEELREWLARQLAAPDGAPLTVFDRATHTPVGVVNYLANHPEHLRIELGSLWYGPIAQGTGAAAEATALLLAHAFGLGYRRVEWKCDAENARSRRAALAYGFTFEGVQDAHYIIKGRNRDTAWFRMLASEWRARFGA